MSGFLPERKATPKRRRSWQVVINAIMSAGVKTPSGLSRWVFSPENGHYAQRQREPLQLVD
jgi:hypothetical protein